MDRLIVLHTNDIHGRIEGIARVATLVAGIRAENPGVKVLYLDAGDLEETSVRLSNLTKGTAMHRLLNLAGCDAAAVGNAAPLRYGPQVLADHAAAARYPLLLANLTTPDGAPLAGTRPAIILDAGALRLGVIGLTAPLDGLYETSFGLVNPPAAPLVRELAAGLRQEGADAVIVLSHLGLPDDRALAAKLQGIVPVIIGAHTHNLLSEGERIGDVLIAQAGEYAGHVGRLDLTWDGKRLSVERVAVLPVTEAIPPSEAVLAEARAVEAEVARFLEDEIGELVAPLDFATDRECGVANLAADMLRERMRAEVAVVAAGQAFTGLLPGGRLRRVALWDVCSSSANPGVAEITGAQLVDMLRRGNDPAFAAETPRTLRGQARGLLHLSGATMRDGRLLIGGQPVEPERAYRVAGTDWELEAYGGYADPTWNLKPTYDVPTIVREAVEEYLAAHRPTAVEGGRLR